MPSPDKYIKVRSGSFPCKHANEATTSYLHAIKTDLRNRVPLRKPCFQGICKTKCYPCNRNFRFGLFLQNLILFSRSDFWSYSCKKRLTRSYSCKQEVKIPIQLCKSIKSKRKNIAPLLIPLFIFSLIHSLFFISLFSLKVHNLTLSCHLI